MNILSVDIGGSHVKVLLSGETVARRTESGPAMSAPQMVLAVQTMAADWPHDVVSIGYPGVVANDRPVHEPANLAPGWVGFDYAAAFGRPVRILNDAAMQALGSYDGGRMLFLGLGTGLGSAMIVDGILQPMELAHLPYKKGRSYEDYVGERGLKRLGKKEWRQEVAAVVEQLGKALEPDYVVLGGGNSKLLKPERLAADVRIGSNASAFVGGFRMWLGIQPTNTEPGAVTLAPAQSEALAAAVPTPPAVAEVDTPTPNGTGAAE